MELPKENDANPPLDYARPIASRPSTNEDPTLFLKSAMAVLFAVAGIPLGSWWIWSSLPVATYAVRSGYPPFRDDEIADAARLFFCGAILFVSGVIFISLAIRAWRRS